MDDLLDAFQGWASSARVKAAAQARARERHLREQLGASATWTGLLVDLAERTTPVTLYVAGGKRSGRLVGVSTDFLVLDQPSGRPALVALRAVAALWSDGAPPPNGGSTDPATAPRGPERAPSGDRGPSLQLSLGAALDTLAQEHAPVAITVEGGPDLVGALLVVGEDVLTLRPASPARRLVHVPLVAVAVCELR